MTEPIRFKFKYLDEEGNESGWSSKKGSFDGETLLLDGEDIPVIAVLKAQRRFNRLLLTVATGEEEPGMLAFAVTKGNVRLLLGAINATTSARWADMHQEALAKEGKAAGFRTHACPHCRSTIDLTDMPATPQVYCPYCETVITVQGSPASDEDQHRVCDECGYFAKPREFTVFYFYFLVFFWGYSSSKRYMCPTCMRSEAWKMFFGNLLFVIGFPFAVIQLLRVYLADKSVAAASHAGLGKANLLSRKGRVTDALQAYMTISQNATDSAGIRYNCGLTFLNADDMAPAIEQFDSALRLCSNHIPSFEALCHCYEASGQPDKLAELRKSWGIEEETPPAVAEPVPE